MATIILYLFSGSKDSEGNYVEHTLEKKEKEGVYMSLAKKIKEEGIKEGIQKGREEGIQQKALETAKRLKILGIDIEKISEATGLSKKEIQDL
jgi:predicted transposase/invertase (TIGR01784 family)